MNPSTTRRRYLYVPLGGRDKAWLSVWPIFLFVAVWHDIEPKLLLWGALNAGFYVIEVRTYNIIA
jgi:protein-cysteine N-palmitoyltransferase HHAT